jgi:hypothetical protein
VCVKTSPKGGEGGLEKFTDNGNGTTTDNATKLMWQKEDDNTQRELKSAITYCEGLSLGGYNDWRLPNKEELVSIIDKTRKNPAINTTYFPNTNSSDYWSSTTLEGITSSAWYVYFTNGYVNYGYKSRISYVRCVRGGQ